jgi:hypothetical protein
VVLTGSATTITVTGTRFYPATVVRLNGVAKTTTYVSATQLRVTLTAADVAAPGSQALTAFSPTPGGGASGSLTLGVANTCTVTQAAITNISVGQTANGTLAAGDCVRSNLAYADVYRLTVSTTTTVTIDLTSSALDTFLELRNSAGTLIASDDDSGVGLNSRLTQVLAPGTYYLYASALSAGLTGAYSLSVVSGGGGGGTIGTNCPVVGSLVRPQTVSGSLSTTDCRLGDGSYADRYQLTISASATVTLTLSSTAFDAYLYLTDASGNVVAEDDDSGGGTNSRISRTLSAGTYYVVANSFSASETGTYTLGVS